MKKKSVVYNKKEISEATLRRFPFYHHYLKQLESDGVKEISSAQIAKFLGFNTIQVRKDIEATKIEGKPKRGYNLKKLISAIEKFLGFYTKNEAVLIGAGHLGYALLGYHGFKEYGLDIIAAFDNNPERSYSYLKWDTGKEERNGEDTAYICHLRLRGIPLSGAVHPFPSRADGEDGDYLLHGDARTVAL